MFSWSLRAFSPSFSFFSALMRRVCKMTCKIKIPLEQPYPDLPKSSKNMNNPWTFSTFFFSMRFYWDIIWHTVRLYSDSLSQYFLKPLFAAVAPSNLCQRCDVTPALHILLCNCMGSPSFWMCFNINKVFKKTQKGHLKTPAKRKSPT